MATPTGPTVDQLIEWVEVIKRDGRGLTLWEEEFIESMEMKVALYRDKVSFSPNQTETIQRIFDQRVK